MRFHPAAEVFPLLQGKEFAALVADIKEHGQLDPILVLDGLILDGRNRWRACEEAKVEPKLKDWSGGNPWDFVWSKNAERRHLEPGQKAAIRYKVDKGSDAWREKHDQAKVEANRARSEAAKEQHKTSNPRKGEKSGGGSREPQPKGTGSHAARTLAESTHTSPATAKRVIALEKQNPGLFEKVCSGEIKLGGACRQAKRNESAERLKGFSFPTSADGPFGVVVADPPWTYDKRAEDDTHRGACPYPCMSLDASDRDWAVWISGGDFGKRADIIHDAVIRFPAAERRRHVLQSWSDVLLVEQPDSWTIKLSGNFGIGLNHRTIVGARYWLEHGGFREWRLNHSDVDARLWEWVARQNLELPLEEMPEALRWAPISEQAPWLWSQPRLTVEQMLTRHHAGRPEGNPVFVPSNKPLTPTERAMLRCLNARRESAHA